MKVLLRSPKIAQRVFGLDSPGQIVRSVPRAKFMFKAEFVPSAAANSMMNNIPLNSSTDIRSVAFKVKTIDKPRINLTTVELNQYNKKKLAYTKVDYGDASIRVYDSVDNSVLALWINYFTYFFGDSRTGKDDVMVIQQSSVGSKYYDSSGWGFRPISEEEYFFKSIDVLAFYGQTVTKFKYMNPRIVSIDWQNKDYSSNDLEEATINFKYESIVYEQFGQPVGNIDTGWQSTDTIDYPYGYASTPAVFQPRMFGNQTTIYDKNQSTTTATNPANIVNSLPYNTGAAAPSSIAPSAIAPGATIPNNLLNSQLLQPNNLVAGLSMALNYIPTGIQGINNFPFTSLLSLGGIKGIGGASQLLGDAVRTQLSGITSDISAGLSSLFGSSSTNIYSAGIPQPLGYMSGVTSSPLPDITTNSDFGSGNSVDPSAISRQATSPASDIATQDIDNLYSASGQQSTLESQLPNSEEAVPIGSIEYAAVEDTPPPSFASDPAPDYGYQEAGDSSSAFEGYA